MPSAVLTSFLAGQHRELDRLLEAADNESGTPQALQAFVRFREAMEHHLGLEERLLFPSLEACMGPGGPLVVMRDEHDAIRDLLQQGYEALGAQELKAYRQVLDTLTVLVQQHHLKEENVLYPMGDTLLSDRAETLLQTMIEAPGVHG